MDDLLDMIDALDVTAQATHEVSAAPERGPYYLHELVCDETALATFLSAFIPVARLAATDKGDVAVADAAREAVNKLRALIAQRNARTR